MYDAAWEGDLYSICDFCTVLLLYPPPPPNFLQYRGLAPMYYRGSAAAIVVYDITSEVRPTTSSSVVMYM